MISLRNLLGTVANICLLFIFFCLTYMHSSKKISNMFQICEDKSYFYKRITNTDIKKIIARSLYPATSVRFIRFIRRFIRFHMIHKIYESLVHVRVNFSQNQVVFFLRTNFDFENEKNTELHIYYEYIYKKYIKLYNKIVKNLF